MPKKSNKLRFVLILSIAIKALGLLYKVITTRLLGLEGMRLMSMILPILALCLSLSSFSIQAVCNQNISLNITTKNYRASTIMLACLRVTLLSSSIVAILMLLSFPIYKNLYGEEFIYYPLLLCVPLIYLSNISGVMKGYFEANNRFSITYFSNTIESITKLIITIFLLYIFKNQPIRFQVTICFLGLMLSEISSCIYLACKIVKKHKIKLNLRTDKYEVKVFKQALPLTLDSMVTTISGYITPFIFYYAASKSNISFFEASSYYALVTAYAVPLLINGQFTTLTLTKLIFPSITKNRDNGNKLSEILNNAMIITIFFSIVSFSLCYFEGEFLLNLLYGNCVSYPIVKSIAPIYILLYFDPIFIVILQAYNKERALFIVSLISQIISMILIYTLTINPNIMLKGYIIGISIGSLVKCILLFILSFKYSKYNPSLGKLLGGLLISIVYLFICSLKLSFIIYICLTLIYLCVGLLFFYFSYNKKQSLQIGNQHT